MARTKKKPPEKDKKMCTMCKRTLIVENNFYNSSSKLSSDGKIDICKKCLHNIFDPEDDSTLYEVLRRINKPFVHDIWSKCKEENSNPLGVYIRQINSLHQYSNLEWEDSKFPKDEKAKDKRMYVDGEVDPEWVIKWGNGYEVHDYITLENFYRDMMNSYEVETASHFDYLRKICRVSLQMDKILDDGDVDGYKKLSDVYDKLMKSAKFTAVQRSASDRSGGMNTFSEFYEFLEKQGFIEKYHTDEPKDIVDATLENLKKFTRTLILGDSSIQSLVEESLKKMHNEVEDYSVDDDDINMDEDIYMDFDDEDESLDGKEGVL